MFVKRLAEELLYAFVGGAAIALQATGDFSTAALTGAVLAGARGALGVIVRNFGEKDRPTVK